MAFSCISHTNHPYKGPFTQKSLRSSVPTVYRPWTNVFLKPQTSLHTKNIVGKVAPLRFFAYELVGFRLMWMRPSLSINLRNGCRQSLMIEDFSWSLFWPALSTIDRIWSVICWFSLITFFRLQKCILEERWQRWSLCLWYCFLISSRRSLWSLRESNWRRCVR